MKFLFPTFLFALFTIAIPVIIHLFSFRRYKTVFFSNVSFLKNIKKESKKKSKLKQLLILLARILALICLIFAFAQPYIPTNPDTKKQPNQLVAVYVDNSFSMNALSGQGQLLEVARNKAVEICLSYPPGTKYKLFTNDLDPKHQNIFNKEQFIQQVSEIQPSPVVVPLSMIYNRFGLQNTEEETDKNLYLISDFQKAITDPENFGSKAIFSYLLPLSPNQTANLFIDSCWVEVPAHRLRQEEEVFVKIKNSSQQDFQDLPLKLYLNDSIKSITNYSVDANSEIIASLKYTNNTPGAQLGKIEIVDYPFTHDNNWYISYFVEPHLKALAIYDKSSSSSEGMNYISSLFKNDDYVLLDQMDVQGLQMSKLHDYNTVFLMNLNSLSSGFLNEMGAIVENGASVVLFPGGGNNYSVNNTFLSGFGTNLITGRDTLRQKISGIEFENPFFEDVFSKREENAILPEINGHFQFSSTTRTTEQNLLWFQNDDKALSVINTDNGKIWVFSFPLDKSNESFARDILFVPTLYNIVLNSLPQQQMSFIIGQHKVTEIRRNNDLDLSSSIEIVKTDGTEKFIPSIAMANHGLRIDMADKIAQDGHYRIQNAGKTLQTFAFNYDRSESELRYFTKAELQDKIKAAQLKNASVVQDVESNFAEIFDEIQNGRQLWKWFIFLALFFILTEVLLLRFWK